MCSNNINVKMSNIREIRKGDGVAFEFTANNNIKHELGVDNLGLKFKGNVGQQVLIPIVCSASVDIDGRCGNMFQIELTENITTFNIVEPSIGTYIIKFVQDSIGGHQVAYASDFKWEGGSTPVITSAADSTDVLSFFYDGASFCGSYMQDFS